MFSRLRLFELKNTKFKTKYHFFIEISKVLEVANFRFITLCGLCIIFHQNVNSNL